MQPLVLTSKFELVEIELSGNCKVFTYYEVLYFTQNLEIG